MINETFHTDFFLPKSSKYPAHFMLMVHLSLNGSHFRGGSVATRSQWLPYGIAQL